MSQRITLQEYRPQTAQGAQRDFNVVTTVNELPTMPALDLAIAAGQLATVVNAVLAADHDLFIREYTRQFEKWCMVNGRPAYIFNYPDLTAETYAAIEKTARVVINQLR